MTVISVSLFVSGRESRRIGFVGSVMRACKRLLNENYQLTIIDLDDDPQLAISRGLLATPALEIKTDHSTHLIVGDLGQESRLGEFLERLSLD